MVQEEVQAFQTRLLKSIYAVIYGDALFVKILHFQARMRKEAVYVTLGLTREGRREVLGFYLFPEGSARIYGSVGCAKP